MKNIKVFDPPMCCSSGVCGSKIDPALIEFAGVVNTIKKAGFNIERYNLSKEPMAFVQYQAAKKFLEDKGQEKLPAIFIDDELVFTEKYPSRNEILDYLCIQTKKNKTEQNNSCCSSNNGCCK